MQDNTQAVTKGMENAQPINSDVCSEAEESVIRKREATPGDCFYNLYFTYREYILAHAHAQYHSYKDTL
jgi:hypothetical protein